jgi:hypothetical protein
MLGLEVVHRRREGLDPVTVHPDHNRPRHEIERSFARQGLGISIA